MLTIIRSIADIFYIIQIYVRFCTAYVAPSSRVFGRGELLLTIQRLLFLIFTLSSQIVQATGIVTKTAWQGAAYNLMLYMLASHVLGASWYLLSIERQEACWISVCKLEKRILSVRFL
ncbi:hypothetical protein CsSME_00040722 [Camellia sinensis var. sinensis]